MSKFFNTNNYSWDLVNKAYSLSEEESERLAKIEACKCYAYYKNSRNEMQYYLYEYMAGIIQQPGALRQMKPIFDNYTRKVIKRLCLAYKEPVELEFSLDSDSTAYEDNIASKLHIWRKEFHRVGKLLNTILIRPIWREKEKAFDFMILHRGICDVEYNESNFNELYKVSYLVEENEKYYRVVWTDTEHYAEDIESGRKTMLTDMDGVNHYGVIPFVVLRMEDCSDFWGDGLSDLVDGNEAVNAALTDMHSKRFMSFGVGVGINTGIDSETFYVSPNRFIDIKSDTGVNQQADFKFVTPDHRLDLDLTFIERFKQQQFISLGLPPDSFSTTTTATSGYAKTIESLELMDLNNDDKDVLRQMEYDLFDLMKIVLDVDSRSIKFRGELLNVNFAEIGFPKSQDEIIKKREFDYKYNMSSPKDWMKEDNPDLLDEDIDKMLIENQAVKQIVEPRQRTPLEIALGNNKQENANVNV